MAKLHFRYGTVGSGKTLDLLKVAYNYEENGMNCIILTSSIDDRYGNDIVKSRTGLSRPATSISEKTNIYNLIKNINKKIDSILVDEIQFFTKEHVYQLAKIVDELDIPVICYGLRSDFMHQPFGCAVNLMAIADVLEEIKTICSHCGKKKSTINGKFVNGKLINIGKQVEIGGNEKYKPLCRKCYMKLLDDKSFITN
ncbi:MAG: thymidine kinase [bacterium]